MADDELGLTWYLLTSSDDVMDDSIIDFDAWQACGGEAKNPGDTWGGSGNAGSMCWRV